MKPPSLLARIAFAWGQAIGNYSLKAVQPYRTRQIGFVPDEPFIGISWHGRNMLALATCRTLFSWKYHAFIPPGIVGMTMKGWLEATGFEAVLLPADGTGNPQSALKLMARSVQSGNRIVIAVDGPHGPAGEVRPGALWLARLTGCPLLPVGYAASPCIRYPRWDGHVIPLLGAQVVVVFGEPIRVHRKQEIGETLLIQVRDLLNSLTEQAEQLAHQQPLLARREN